MDWSSDLVQWLTSAVWSALGIWGELIGGASSASDSDGDFDQFGSTNQLSDPFSASAGGDTSTQAYTAEGNTNAYNSINSSSIYADSGLSETPQVLAPLGLVSIADTSPSIFDLYDPFGPPDTSEWLAQNEPLPAPDGKATAADFGVNGSTTDPRLPDSQTIDFTKTAPGADWQGSVNGQTFVSKTVVINGTTWTQGYSNGVLLYQYASNQDGATSQTEAMPEPAPDPTPTFADPSYQAETTGVAPSAAPAQAATVQPRSGGLLGTASQVMSGTYANSVLQSQLANQGATPGSFVSPVAPYDYLFNPNATGLGDAMLLASHSPNVRLSQAEQAQLGVSMAPVVGSVATWMNPRSNWIQKSVAVLGVLPVAAGVVGKLGSLSGIAGDLAGLSELGGLSNEVGELAPKLTIQDILDLIQELNESDIDVISVKGAGEWTQAERQALDKYYEVYKETGSYLKAGDAFHAELGAASDGVNGPDRMMFDFVNEVKTSAGHPDVGVFAKALAQAEGHAASGFYDGATATVYDVLNGVKYFVQSMR